MPTDQVPISDRYERGEVLGRGGMGVVWRATDRLLERQVAVKEIHFPPTLAEDERETIKGRVLREARSAARLNHPSAVSVFDVVQADGLAYIVMELIDAPTLSELVKENGPLAPEEAARIGAEVLSALEAAHAEGIVHRDVKPANVMVPPRGQAKLADFGIASVKDDPRLTASGIVLGSPAFMAPEQATTGASNAASDLWGLGATLYFAVEGKPPFEEGSAVATLAAVMNDDLEMSGRAGHLEAVIRALLDKDPDKRPSADELRRALTDIADPAAAHTAVAPAARPSSATVERAPDTTDTVVEERSAAEPAPPVRTPEPSYAPDSPRRGGRGWWMIAALLAVLAIGATLLLSNDDSPPERAGNGTSAEDDEQGGGAPEGWATYTDDATGYSIAYPEDWEQVPAANNANQMDFRDPDSSTYLRIEWRQPPGDDAVAAWEASEQSFRTRFSDYERVRLEATEYKGMEAALWEYTYASEGAELHAYNLGFITEDESYGLALNFQTRAGDWDDSQDLWDAFKDSFTPP